MNAYTPTTTLSDLATPLEIRTALDQGIAAARADGRPDHIGAIDALIDLCVQRGACFSSGELSAWIRTYRPDVRFNPMSDVGSHLRSRHGSDMPAYATGPVVQVSRYTQGFSSTSYGHLVYVYAPSHQAGGAHLFEVQTPSAGGAVPALDSLPPVPTQPAAPLYTAPPARRSRTAAATKAAPARKAKARRARKSKRKASRTLPPNTAAVHGNRRLCVPRSVFEGLATLRGAPLPGGTAVYVARTGDTVSVTLAAADGATPYTLVATRGRLLFASHGGPALVPGTRYAVQVTQDGLTIDLSAPV